MSRENLLGEVDDLINESLPKRVEEMLRGDFFAGEAKIFLDTTINNALARPIPEIIGNVAPEQLERLNSYTSVAADTPPQGGFQNALYVDRKSLSQS